MRVPITQEHIDQGVKGDCYQCPAIFALRELYPGERISVGTWEIHIGEDKYPTPGNLSNWIHDFDSDLRVFPIEFELKDKLIR